MSKRKMGEQNKVIVEINQLRAELEVLRLAIEIVGEYVRRRGIVGVGKRVVYLRKQADKLGERLKQVRGLLVDVL